MRRRRPGDGDDRRAAELTGLADVTAAELDDLLRREERLVLVVCAIVAVEAGDAPEAVRRHGVTVFPTLVFFKRGRELHRLRGGALPESTLRLLEEPL
ncbi:MAG: thioredoxin family protein [Chloroflexi bacterium]|nr:MAG: thioredoxin family protein [Chloroflexota bacterium]